MQEHVLLLDDDWFTCQKLVHLQLSKCWLVFSQYLYVLPVWGPALHTDSLSHLRWLHNCSAVRLTCDLHKYDHVSNHRECLGWLPVDSFVRYRSLLTLFQDYYTSRSVPFNPAFEFGGTHFNNSSKDGILSETFSTQSVALVELLTCKLVSGHFWVPWQSFCLLISMCYSS